MRPWRCGGLRPPGCAAETAAAEARHPPAAPDPEPQHRAARVRPRPRSRRASSCLSIGPGIGTLDPWWALPTLGLPPGSREGFALSKSTVLVVDDEELYRRALERILKRVGYEVVTARDASEALAIVSSQPVDLVLSDVQMPGINGLELVRQLKDAVPDLPCIVITGYGSPEQSIESLKAGAFWYLEKPFDQGHLDVVRKLVEQAIEMGRLRSENRMLQRQLRNKYGFDNIIGTSTALRRVLDMVAKVAETESTVLITGESGTGKELIARAVHFNSHRSERMFVTVNCGAIPEELLESELFGHVKGAFTNAVSHREGRFSVADGGTLFLDEIGDMSPNLQVKLLRVLQDRTFEPVGSSTTQRVDVRVVAATNQDLEVAIREKRFREDLFYRLNVIPVEMPPLRERREDISLLVQHFLEKGAAEGAKTVSFEEATLRRMAAYDWPGNVRELENVVERLAILCGDHPIGEHDLPQALQQTGDSVAVAVPQLPSGGLALRNVVDEIESDLILQALEQTHWNKNQAAQLLGLNRTTLIEKIKKKGLKPPPPPADLASRDADS
ncbi:MAG: sigma-54-dependent Fis family transcriptional regulator [Deltaproteobacteria bacterium]|nr:sigma-54-dependent Fis family transcriptional regulator [Deltaproteobacteria bacterium]